MAPDHVCRPSLFVLLTETDLSFLFPLPPVVILQSKLVLRFKPATSEEIYFINTLNESKDGIFAHETYLPPTGRCSHSVYRLFRNISDVLTHNCFLLCTLLDWFQLLCFLTFEQCRK